MSQDLRTPPSKTTEGRGREPEPPRPRLPPVGYPLVALAVGTALVWAFSRILLAVTETHVEIVGVRVGGKSAAAFIALLMALNVLIGAALVAYGRRVRRRPASLPILVAAGFVVIGLGAIASTVIGQEEKPPGGGPAAQAVPLTASGIAFDTDQISVPEGGTVRIQFKNQDAGVPHNFALYSDDTAAQALFEGPIVTGPATTTYSFPTPPPGQYFFRCDVHPTQMTGTFTVGGGGAPSPSGGGGGPPGPPSPAALTAEGIAFHPTELTAKPEGGKVTIHFDNRDAGVPHNVAVFQGSDATGAVIFRGDIVTGPGTADYTFDAPPPGTYFFHCDVHPQMQGTITIG